MLVRFAAISTAIALALLALVIFFLPESATLYQPVQTASEAASFVSINLLLLTLRGLLRRARTSTR